MWAETEQGHCNPKQEASSNEDGLEGWSYMAKAKGVSGWDAETPGDQKQDDNWEQSNVPIIWKKNKIWSMHTVCITARVSAQPC